MRRACSCLPLLRCACPRCHGVVHAAASRVRSSRPARRCRSTPAATQIPWVQLPLQELTAHELNKARLYVTDHDVMGLPPIRPTDQVGAVPLRAGWCWPCFASACTAVGKAQLAGGGLKCCRFRCCCARWMAGLGALVVGLLRRALTLLGAPPACAGGSGAGPQGHHPHCARPGRRHRRDRQPAIQVRLAKGMP